MKEQLGDVQKNFMDLSIFLSGLDFEKDLLKQSNLENLNRELKKSYVMFDEGLCDNVPFCTKCGQSQAQLKELVTMIDLCTQNELMTAQAHEALNDFIEVIPQILLEMKTIYLESLLDRS